MAQSPAIYLQPQNQTLFTGATINLRIGASAPTPLTYQWFFNSHALASQTNDSLRLTNVGTNASGNYAAVVGTTSASVTSAVAIVSVNRMESVGGGYANPMLPLGYSLTGLLLTPSANQTVGAMFTLVSNGTTIVKVDGNGYVANNYLNGWADPEMTLAPGEGWFVRNPTTNAMYLTIVGSAIGGYLTNRLPAGLAICKSILPVAGTLSGELRFPVNAGTAVYFWDNAHSRYDVYRTDGSVWSPYEPTVDLLAAFWVKSQSPQDWVRAVPHPYGDSDTIYGSFFLPQPLIESETAAINFFTWNTDEAFGKVFDLDGSTPLNSAFCAQLYYSRNIAEGFIPAGRPVPFQEGSSAGWIRSGCVPLPGIRGNETVPVQLRAWEKAAGPTYEDAVANGGRSGQSQAFSAFVHAPVEAGEPGPPPSDANGFSSFRLTSGSDPAVRITAIHRLGDGIQLRFTTRVGRSYQVRWTTALRRPIQWQTVTGAESVMGTGEITEVTHLIADGQPHFYRIEELSGTSP